VKKYRVCLITHKTVVVEDAGNEAEALELAIYRITSASSENSWVVNEEKE